MPSFIFSHAPDAAALALAIVDTVREPLLVLDKELRVLAASRSFYLTFNVTQDETEDRLLYELGDCQWDIPGLRTHLETIVPERGVMDAYEVDRQFPKLMREILTRPCCWELRTSPFDAPWSGKGKTCFGSRRRS
jgi:PAS domain-containing protein